MADSAPLLATAGAPVPEGGRAEWFTGSGGLRLRAALFPAQGQPRGSVVLGPGRSEPIEKYFEVVRDLTGRGFEVLAHDWRGQGLSQRLLPDPMKGHADGYEHFLADHRILVDTFAPRLPGPLIMFGHSMGGGLNLLSLMRGETRFAAAFLSAPMMAVITGPIPARVARGLCAAMRLIGRDGAYVAKGADPLGGRFEGNPLTHDEHRYDLYKSQLRAHPELALGGVTWGWLDFALQVEIALRAPGAPESVATPVDLVMAGEERLVVSGCSEGISGRMPRSRCLTIPGALHEILMETDEVRAQVWAEFDRLADEVAR